MNASGIGNVGLNGESSVNYRQAEQMIQLFLDLLLNSGLIVFEFILHRTGFVCAPQNGESKIKSTFLCMGKLL